MHYDSEETILNALTCATTKEKALWMIDNLGSPFTKSTVVKALKKEAMAINEAKNIAKTKKTKPVDSIYDKIKPVDREILEHTEMTEKESFWNFLLPKSMKRRTQTSYYNGTKNVSEKSVYHGDKCVKRSLFDSKGNITRNEKLKGNIYECNYLAKDGHWYREDYNPETNKRKVFVPISHGTREITYNGDKLISDHKFQTYRSYGTDSRSGIEVLTDIEKYRDGELIMREVYDGPPLNRVLVSSYNFNPNTGVKCTQEWQIHETGYRVKSSSSVEKNGVVLREKNYNSDGKLMEEMSYNPKTGVTQTDEWQIHETGYRVKSSSSVEKNGVVLREKNYNSDGKLMEEMSYNPKTGVTQTDEWQIHETGYRVKSSSSVEKNGVVLHEKVYDSNGKLIRER